MLRVMVTIAAVLAILYLGLCAALFLFQRSLICFPQPRRFGDDGADEVAFLRKGAILIGNLGVLIHPEQVAAYHKAGITAFALEHAPALKDTPVTALAVLNDAKPD